VLLHAAAETLHAQLKENTANTIVMDLMQIV
jgi:hypothetical protein